MRRPPIGGTPLARTTRHHLVAAHVASLSDLPSSTGQF